MQQFKINLPALNKSARVYSKPFHLTVLKEEGGQVRIENLELKEYYVMVDGYYTIDPTKHKVYRNIMTGQWYDKNFSEDAEFNSPEFGIPEINAQVKQAIDRYETENEPRLATTY